jgi:hypothetical protein
MDNGPLWAPDSSTIAYARLGDPAHPDESASHAYLVVMPIDAPAEPKAIYDEITGSMSWPGWSPDGTWLAVGLRDSAPSKGILVRPDGSSVTSFAVQGAVGAPECGFSFAPDGLSLVSGCEGFKRYWLSDLEHPDVLPLPSGAAGMSWQRGSAP